MLYAIKIAWRYLTSNPLQSWLLVLGVAVGVFVFVFMSALIGGLAVYLVDRTVGNVAHISLTLPEAKPQSLFSAEEGALVAAEKASSRTPVIRNVAEVVSSLGQIAGPVAVSPQIVGNGFVTRGAIVKPVSVIGVEPENVSAIANVRGNLVAGTDFLPIGSALIGTTLAQDLGTGVGQQLRLRSDRGVELTLTIAGVYSFGLDALDERSVYVNTKTARGLFDMLQGVNRIEVKLDDLWKAPDLAPIVGSLTGLEATPWTAGNAQLLSGLDAQARSGNIIKGFALVTIVIGVASALLLSTYRRRSEIGIMRAMGSSRGFVVLVFVMQGGLIGLAGGLLGAGLAWAALSPFPAPGEIEAGGLPIDIAQGGFDLAIGLTLIGALLAAILPARSAARVDPVEVISQ